MPFYQKGDVRIRYSIARLDRPRTNEIARSPANPA
jgi:hypothetical protein